ncbi:MULTISPECIES: hypothetical protein [unclassified Breznakia]|uniref:hypothetical protein n=1 Tax=unclassified Breznakia TaxID=2623764 RepID=UPI0024767D32|nr:MULTISPECIES: hypothetical protein [unclassified Breznakia]MDH6367850.1 hypothetical protein [Breznakia sp. PH1-1]MDH6404938.1 hypothetical protein [Breznakia sp. PF1-11]MDH6412653.1 hypothetical protein [Breznakia sp. PFB1-11]MDH6415044.1 hypothetical protein [Breznakia sp. PFB1-14]MDH6417324.1 hypothetical protein [Breznakia sp. PFB1-4]
MIMNSKDAILKFLTKIHADADYKCKIALTKSWDIESYYQKIMYDLERNRFYDRLMNIDTFLGYAESIIDANEEDVYFSINSFRHRKKEAEHVWHLNAIVLDFDYYKIEEFKDLNAMDMYEKVLKEKLPHQPTAVIDSGRGLYIVYAFKNCPRRLTKTYKAIYKEFLSRFETYGMDPKAMNVTQIIRLPGSFNSKSMSTVQILEFNDTDYTISSFFDMFKYKHSDVITYKEKLAEKRNRSKANKVAKGVYQLTLNDEMRRNKNREKKSQEFFNDFRELIRIRNKNNVHEGYREYILYLARCRVKHHKGSIDEELEIAHELNELFLTPLEEKEVIVTSEPRGFKKCPSIETMIKNLEITDEEQMHLKVLRSKSKKDIAYQKRKRIHILTNMSKAQMKQLERRTRVAKLKNEGKRNVEIANILSINKSTVTRDLKYINENAWRFKKKLQEAMKELQACINTNSKIRHVRFDEQKRLSEWLKLSEELLN